MRKTQLIKNVKNIQSVLDNLASRFKFEPNKLIPQIIAVNNFIKKKGSGAFEMIDDICDEDFENSDNEFSQTLDIRAVLLDEVLFVVENFNNEEIFLELKNGFKKPQNDREFSEFCELVFGLVAKRGAFLRNLESLKNIIRNFLDSNTQKISLIKALNFKDSTPSVIKSEIKNIDLNKKNIICAKKDSKICSLFPAFDGKAGRNLAGIFIKPAKKESFNLAFSDAIYKKELPNCVEFYNKESGFVILEEKNIGFCVELSLQNVSLKDNYNFIGELDSNTNLTIATNDELLDALGGGVCVMANNITINGNVAASAQISAKYINILGQSHRDSNIFAESLKINVAKGKMCAKNAVIENFENGEIDCENLTINKANGGLMYAKNIEIKEIYSNANIYFSTKCEINNLKGSNNKLIFSANGDRILREKIKNLEQIINQRIELKKNLAIKLELQTKQYEKYKITAQKLKTKILRDRANNIPTKDYILQNYNAFLKIIDVINALMQDIKTCENEIKSTKNEMESMKKINAELLVKSGWLKYNDVILEYKNISKTIIKEIGRYTIENEDIAYQKIFSSEAQTIDNRGF